MKKTLFGFMALATAFAAVSCQSDEEFAQQSTNKPMVINAVAEGIGAGTRAEMAYKYDILWNDDDEIFVKDNGTNTATFTLTAGSGTTNGTFACESSPLANGAEVEAFYPASVGESLVWPAEQKSDIVVPMYSKKTLGSTGSENFSFASLGAVLQIVFNTEQAGVTLKSITLKDGTNPLSGTFTVNAGKAVMAANADAPGITYDLGTGMALGKSANFFNIAVPADTYSNLTITFTATDNSTCTLKGSVTINHNTVGRLILTGKEFIPEGALPGKFTVNSEGKQVRFSKGNLWADSDNALHFEANQYSSASTKDASHVSHFTWSSTVEAAVGYFNNGDYLFCDENHKVSVDGSDAIYYTLSKDEWEYLFNNHSYKWVTVNNVNGYVIAPDGFTGTLAASYNDDAALATNNLVFLPAAGDCDFGDVNGQGDYGSYWSSTPVDNDDDAYYLDFSSGHQFFVSDYTRSGGCSVRAVVAK